MKTWLAAIPRRGRHALTARHRCSGSSPFSATARSRSKQQGGGGGRKEVHVGADAPRTSSFGQSEVLAGASGDRRQSA